MGGPVEELTAREEALLSFIVAQYIHTASPVGSQTVARIHSHGVSPATVRHDMAELEEAGYIKRAHASAGAIPSDKGYRFYVERLSRSLEPPPGMRSLIRRQFRKGGRDLATWTRLAAMILAQVVQNVALATFPRAEQSRIKHLELVQLQEFLVLLIVVLQKAQLRQQLLPLKEPVAKEELRIAVNKLNSSFAGMTRHEVRTVKAELSPLESHVMEETLRLMQVEDKEVFGNHYMDGLGNMLGQPEFSRSGRAQEAVAVLEDREMMRAMLSQAPEEGVRVIIGEENERDRLHSFSVVICQYGVPGEAMGAIGTVGPTRMDYSATIASVQCMSGFMSQLMSGIHGYPN